MSRTSGDGVSPARSGGDDPGGQADGRRATALSEAARQRRTREATVDDLRHGRSELADVLARAALEPEVGAIKIVKLVEAVPGVGKVMARRTLADLGVAEDLRAGELGAARSAGLVGALIAGAAPA